MKTKFNIISTFISIIILALSAGFSFADEPDIDVERLCIEQYILADGEYMNSAGNLVEGTGWVGYTRWVSAGSVVELFDPLDGDYAVLMWFSGMAQPVVETVGNARVTIHAGADAEAFCSPSIDTGIYDGRINVHFNHMLSAVYPATDGFSVFQYSPDSGVSTLDFSVTWDEIEAKMAVADEELEWQLIATGASGSFLVGSGGQCFIVSPNAEGIMQTFSWQCA